jgi:hypothetical protein
MANVNDLVYHGIRQQVRRVLDLLGEERTDKGLTAFEDGGKNWSQCFFARALAPERLHSEQDVARILDLKSTNGQLNLVPVRIIYRTFDECSTMITREELRDFIVSVRDESRPDEVMKLLRSLNFEGAESTPIEMGVSCV